MTNEEQNLGRRHTISISAACDYTLFCYFGVSDTCNSSIQFCVALLMGYFEREFHFKEFPGWTAIKAFGEERAKDQDKSKLM